MKVVLNQTDMTSLSSLGDNTTEWNETDLAVVYQELMCQQEYVNYTRGKLRLMLLIIHFTLLRGGYCRGLSEFCVDWD